MVKIHVKWKTESKPQPAWTELTLAVPENPVPEGIIDLQLHLIENKVQKSKIIIGLICGTFF